MAAYRVHCFILNMLCVKNRTEACVSFSMVYQIFITVTSQWVRWCLKSPASPLFTRPFSQAQIKENIKAPRHWPLCGEFTGDRWISRTKMASNAENVSSWWRHPGINIFVHMTSFSMSEEILWHLEALQDSRESMQCHNAGQNIDRSLYDTESKEWLSPGQCHHWNMSTHGIT